MADRPRARVDADVVATGWWKDTGRLEDLLDANRIVLDALSPRTEGVPRGDSGTPGAPVIEQGVKLVDSFVPGPAIIGRGARLVRTVIGSYTSIAGEVRDRRPDHRALGDHAGGQQREHDVVADEHLGALHQVHSWATGAASSAPNALVASAKNT